MGFSPAGRVLCGFVLGRGQPVSAEANYRTLHTIILEPPGGPGLAEGCFFSELQEWPPRPGSKRGSALPPPEALSGSGLTWLPLKCDGKTPLAAAGPQ